MFVDVEGAYDFECP